MRILIVSQLFEDGYFRGAEQVAINTAKWLSNRHAVEILSLGDCVSQDRLEGLQVNRVPFRFAPRPAAHGLQLGAESKMVWHARNSRGGVSPHDLRECLKRVAPDVVYAHKATAFMPQLSTVCTDLKLPLVLHLHDYNLLCPRTTMYKSGQNCIKQCLPCRALTSGWRQAGKNVSDVIAVSKFVREKHEQNKLFLNARWHVVHNGDGSKLDSFIPKSGGLFTFGYIGALTPQKGLDDLVAAFASLPHSFSTRLVIAGRGDDDYVTAAKERLTKRPVDWLGQVPLNDFYSQVDCVIVPSRWNEPQGLVVGEALRRGLPVIASDRGGITEVIGSREGHILYDPATPGALRAAMVEMDATRPTINPEPLNPGFFERIESILFGSMAKELSAEGNLNS